MRAGMGFSGDLTTQNTVIYFPERREVACMTLPGPRSVSHNAHPDVSARSKLSTGL